MVAGQGVCAVGHMQHTWSCSPFARTNKINKSCTECLSGRIPYYATLGMWQDFMQNNDMIDIHPTTTQNTDMYMRVRV